MSALDKSLDDIIRSGKPKKFGNKSKKPVGKSVGKGVGKAKINKPRQTKKIIVPKGNHIVDVSTASKVVVHNLPKDLKLDNIRVCLN